MSHYDAIVIGAGPGGYPCAIRLGQLGKKTLIIEKEYWGGVCLNVGCIPSKALITAAKRYQEFQHADALGIVVTGDVSVDMQKLQDWKSGVVEKLSGGVQMLLKANSVEKVFGTATLTAKNTVSVASTEGTQVFTADHIVLATGSRPVQIPGFNYADPFVYSSTDVLALTEVPKRLVVIGGGVIGLEMGGMLAKLGCEVTVVEMADQILPGFEKDVVKLLVRRLKKDGITFYTKARALGWEKTDGGIQVNIDAPKKGLISLPCDGVLVTVGRSPNSKELGLEALGVTFDGPFIKTDKQLKTNVPGLYAIGDVIGQPMLAHKATHDGEVCAEVIAGHDVIWDAKTIPSVVFTDPEIATAGLNEDQAKAAGHPIKVGKMPFAAIGRAIANNETDGFVKVVIHAETKLILGVTIVGYHASDLISEAALAIEMCAEALDVGLTIHPHPTLGESMMEACKAALGEAIHVVNR